MAEKISALHFRWEIMVPTVLDVDPASPTRVVIALQKDGRSPRSINKCPFRGSSSQLPMRGLRRWGSGRVGDPD